MGSNPKQALGLVLFLAGFTLFAAGFAMNGSVILIALGLLLVAAALGVLYKVKPLEHIES